MTQTVLSALGGIGLFLLGMLVLTEGLKGLAGATQRRLLARFTRSPLSGAIAGAATTAVVQSSSATTLTAVGFVGAGLLTFPQALGIVFGANIGTTVTGWLVALFGFKLPLGTIALPLLFLAVLLRLFGDGRVRQAGWSLAGFALLFVAIDFMQQGLAGLEGRLTPADFPDDTILGRLQLLAIGMALTAVTQSSSAGIAAAMVALAAGTISLPQAAAMAIGMDIGTTFKAVLAAIGGSTAMRQTGLAHLLYNLLTAAMAFLLLDPFALLAGRYAAGEPELALVAFHSGFNILGVVLVLPFADRFARLIVWLVPERGPPLTRQLDERLLGDPGSAIDAALASLTDISRALFAAIRDLIEHTRPQRVLALELGRIGAAIEQVQAFMEHIQTTPRQQRAHARHLALLHVLDHLERLLHRAGQGERIDTLIEEPRLARLARLFSGALASLPENGDTAPSAARFDRLRRLYRDQRHSFRARTADAASQHLIDTEAAFDRLDSIRWLHRSAYHVWRILEHLGAVAPDQPRPPPAEPPAAEFEED